MKNKIIAHATAEDVQYVADNMRVEDQKEIWASDRFTPIQALQQGVDTSKLLWTVIVEGLPAAIGGVVPLPTDVHPQGGVCWMLSTDRLKLAPYWFLDESKVILWAMLMKYDYLTNFVDARNVVCLNWLRWLGFKMLPAVPYGAEQIMFIQVIREV